jgi:renalase
VDKRVIVIGAGLCGVACARLLHRAGIAVTILEKSRGIGGRVATRHFGPQHFNYGAPQLDVSDASLAAAISSTQIDGSLGLRSLLAPLAAGLPVELQQRCLELVVDDDCVHLRMTDGRLVSTDTVVVTAPLPQGLELLPAALRYKIDPALLTLLLGVTYQRSIVVSMLVDSAVVAANLEALPSQHFLGRVQTRSTKDGQLWLAEIHRNQIDVAFEKTDDELVLAVSAEMSSDGASFTPLASHVHRWKYARVENPLSMPWADIATGAHRGRIVFAGDAFGSAGDEGTSAAWRSGEAVARYLIERQL